MSKNPLLLIHETVRYHEAFRQQILLVHLEQDFVSGTHTTLHKQLTCVTCKSSSMCFSHMARHVVFACVTWHSILRITNQVIEMYAKLTQVQAASLYLTSGMWQRYILTVKLIQNYYLDFQKISRICAVVPRHSAYRRDVVHNVKK